MALTNGRNGASGPLIFLNTRSKDAEGEKLDTPYFEVVKYVDGKAEKQPEKPTQVSGTLVRIDFKERPIKNTIMKSVLLSFRDDAANETYALDANYRIATRSLFNMVIGLERFENLNLSYYLSRKGYEAFSLRQDDVLVPWKFKLEDLPEAEEIKDRHGNLVKTDFSPIDDFYEAELRLLAERLNPKKEEKAVKKTATKPATVSPTATEAGLIKKKVVSKTASAPAAASSVSPAYTPGSNVDEDVPF